LDASFRIFVPEVHKVNGSLLRGVRTRMPEVSVAGRMFPVDVVHHPRARRYVVRVTPDGRLRLTVPRRASIAGGLRFVDRQHAWIEREWRRLEARAAAWTTGTPVWYRGERTVLTVDNGRVVIGERMHEIAFVQGDVRVAVERSLRALATRELPARTQDMARVHGIAIAGVSVRNQRSRWGSCSTRGTIALNWRLIQMPAHVSDYVIVHELAHRRQPNHSPRFWREVEALFPAWRESERWLRKYGKELL
jgi:predicted metal-dependent hydrolase